MPKMPALWDASTRKETFDLLVALWPLLEDGDRDALVARIAAGPPAWSTDHLAAEDRDQLLARRVFERLRIMERSDPGHPHAGLEAELARLLAMHPNWDIAPGEKAHFAIYSQSGWRMSDATDDKQSLQIMTPAEIVEELGADDREDTLDAWREMVASDWDKMQAVLQGAVERYGLDAELWTTTLNGLRTRAASPTPGANVLALVASMDTALALNAAVSAAAAYLLESAASSPQFGSASHDDFWLAFDNIALGVSLDDTNARHPEEGDWVSLAINTSMGNLALAFVNALFAKRLVVGGGMPNELAEWFVRLIGDGDPRHRPARVVFASRLSYLFAIDPDLIRSYLLPSFRWGRDEVEALAVWQGFGWQPHIDPLLWPEIKTDLLECFTEDRVGQLGDMVGTLSQVLAAAGIHIGLDALPRQSTQAALRRMDSETRAGVLQWLAGALARVDDQASDPDRLWTDRVKPWIQKFWPRDPDARGSPEARPWVELALATNDAFEDAVETVSPFIRRGENSFVLHEMAESPHVNTHPRAALKLMDAFLSRDAQFWSFEELRRLLDGVVAADTTLRTDPIFVQWNEFERARA
ncbi:hypothetical protein [Luteimonas fraxinea]|uniref:hypothetical protein n=1 Tax=Luteimonas fraxinea TaxID=2901869 RepID=UPI001E3E425C|nr:hypothetical protein [Luteimonas fraxinea]MCD9125401.1 hypothetical protein [Luteimonas fraxinea]